MSDKNWFKRVEDKFPWSLLSVVLGVIFFAVGTYLAFKEKKPNLTYEIINKANVFDVHKPLKELSISFRGEDIKEKKQHLTILAVKISNTGNLDILQSYYDSNQPWGLQITNAKIVEDPRLIEASSEYISSNLKPAVGKDNFIKFEKIILEKDNYFTIEMLTLHAADVTPSLISVGKVAGVDKPEVVLSLSSVEEQPLIKRVIGGNIQVQVLRAVFYLVAFILFILLMILFDEQKSKYKRRRKIKNVLLKIERLLNVYKAEEKDIATKLVRASSGTLESLRRFQSTVEDPVNLESFAKFSESKKEVASSIMLENFYFHGFPPTVLVSFDENSKPQVNAKALKILKEIITLLEKIEKKERRG